MKKTTSTCSNNESHKHWWVKEVRYKTHTVWWCWEPPCLVLEAVNPPWLRLRPWDHKPLRRQSLFPWQGCCPCPLYPAWPWAWPVSQWRVRFLKGEMPWQAWSRRDPHGRTRGAIEKGGEGPLLLSFDIAWVLILSARSLLISWLPYFPSLT